MSRMKSTGLCATITVVVFLPVAVFQIVREHNLALSYFRVVGLQYRTELSSRLKSSAMPSGTGKEDEGNVTSMRQPWGFLELDNSTSYCDVVRRSRLYSTECNNLGQGTPRRILITSTGRSGTSFLEFLLRDVGLQVGHDNHKIPLEKSIHGAVSWVHAFNADKCDYPGWAWRRRLQNTQERSWERKDTRNFLHVLHIVRDPLLSIRSRWNKGDLRPFSAIGRCNTAQRIEKDPNSTISKEKVSLRETLRHWVLWHTFIESYTGVLFRTESITGVLVHQIYDMAGELNPEGEENFPSMGKNVSEIDAMLHNASILSRRSNSDHTNKPTFNFTWDTMDRTDDSDYVAMAQMMARRYGYDISEELIRKNELYRKKQICGFNEKDLWDCKLDFV